MDVVELFKSSVIIVVFGRAEYWVLFSNVTPIRFSEENYKCMCGWGGVDRQIS